MFLPEPFSPRAEFLLQKINVEGEEEPEVAEFVRCLKIYCRDDAEKRYKGIRKDAGARLRRRDRVGLLGLELASKLPRLDTLNVCNLGGAGWKVEKQLIKALSKLRGIKNLSWAPRVGVDRRWRHSFRPLLLALVSPNWNDLTSLELRDVKYFDHNSYPTTSPLYRFSGLIPPYDIAVPSNAVPHFHLHSLSLVGCLLPPATILWLLSSSHESLAELKLDRLEGITLADLGLILVRLPNLSTLSLLQMAHSDADDHVDTFEFRWCLQWLNSSLRHFITDDPLFLPAPSNAGGRVPPFPPTLLPFNTSCAKSLQSLTLPDRHEELAPFEVIKLAVEQLPSLRMIDLSQRHLWAGGSGIEKMLEYFDARGVELFISGESVEVKLRREMEAGRRRRWESEHRGQLERERVEREKEEEGVWSERGGGLDAFWRSAEMEGST